MNRYNNLKKLYSEIELLESVGLIKAANVLHKKFVKEAQDAFNGLKTQDAKNFMIELDTAYRSGQPMLGVMQKAERAGLSPQEMQILKGHADKLTNQAKNEFDSKYPNTDYLFEVIKSLAEQFEDYIQDAILGRDTNNSLTAAKFKIDEVEKYLGPQYSQNIKDYAQEQLDIMRKRYAGMYHKYQGKPNPAVQQNQMPSNEPIKIVGEGEEAEKELYMRALTEIIENFKSRVPELINQGEKTYEEAYSQFKNELRKKYFANQIQRLRNQYNTQRFKAQK